MRAQRGMRICHTSRFVASLAAIVAQFVRGEQPLLPRTAPVVPQPSNLDDMDAANGPDPFFDDLDYCHRARHGDQKADDHSGEKTKGRKISYFVEVYENEYKGLGRRWQKRGRPPRWSYEVRRTHR